MNSQEGFFKILVCIWI